MTFPYEYYPYKLENVSMDDHPTTPTPGPRAGERYVEYRDGHADLERLREELEAKTCPRCEVDGYWYRATMVARDELAHGRKRITELEGLVGELLTRFAKHHKGSCCTIDSNGKTTVTVESCKCEPLVQRARALARTKEPDRE